MVARLAGLAGVAAALALAIARLDAGGWVVVTVTDLPDYMVAGRPVQVSYAVRQHGVSLTPGLRGFIDARDARGALVKAAATAARADGHYVATLALPAAGDWTLTVDSGFPTARSAPIAMKVVSANAPSPHLAAADRGARLFAAKGCITCHTHSAVGPPGLAFAPDLTTPRFAPDFLKAYLADPSIKPRAQPNVMMPNLGLNGVEIDALVSFLTTPMKKAPPAVAAR